MNIYVCEKAKHTVAFNTQSIISVWPESKLSQRS